MQNSLIIQSADPSFDSYYKQMLKRKIQTQASGKFGSGFTQEIASPRGTLLFVKGKRPPARDGHTAIILNNQFIVFGGDRHQMPYNDMFVLDLDAEFSLKPDLFK